VIVSDGAGGAIIAWSDGRDGAYDIYAQRLNAAGVPQWTLDGIPVCTQPNGQYILSMVSDDVGGAVLVWYDSRTGTQDIYAQRVNGSGTALWTADGVSVCSAGNDQRDPYIVRSGANFVVTWWDYRAGSDSDIYAQSLNLSGTPLWTVDGVQLTSVAGLQLNPRVCTDGSGGALVTWEDLRNGNRDIYARLVNSLGTVQWSSDGVVVCNAANDQYEPQIVGDGAAGAFIAWYDWRSGPADMYLQRIDYSGASLFTANGMAICTEAGIQHAPYLAQDYSGGAIVVWADPRKAPDTTDIYGQRVNAAGAIQWAANGMPLCTAPGLQLYPRIIREPIGVGGFLLTWFDYRTGNPDVYAQRLDYDGPLWTPGGVVLGTDPHLQEMASICSDGAGGAIVTWRDLRDDFYFDVYAEHVNGTPTPVGDTPAGSRLSVRPNYPNPFTGETALQVGLSVAADVHVEIYDVAGRRVRDVSFAGQARGWSTLRIDGRDRNGALLPSGVYFYRVRAGAETVTNKMVISR
jgi:predicted lipoprotein with Yx(FWY)xxD motif